MNYTVEPFQVGNLKFALVDAPDTNDMVFVRINAEGDSLEYRKFPCDADLVEDIPLKLLNTVDDEDEWEVIDKCTPKDLPHLQKVAAILEADEELVLFGFPNTDDY